VSDSALSAAADGGKARAARTGEKRPNVITRVLTYIRQVVAELRKVIWPTRNELVTYTTVVLVFVIVMVSIVSAFDFAFTQAVLAVFGK
jgi:preprotein translocase subunit SecE